MAAPRHHKDYHEWAIFNGRGLMIAGTAQPTRTECIDDYVKWRQRYEPTVSWEPLRAMGDITCERVTITPRNRKEKS